MRRTRKQSAEIALLRYATLAEALFSMLLARLAILVCFRRITRWALDRHPRATADVHPHLAGRLRWALARTAGWMPGDRGCLPNAIAAKAMLARRGISSTIHLGVGRHPAGALHAHAWLEAGGTILTGEGRISGLTRIPR